MVKKKDEEIMLLQVKDFPKSVHKKMKMKALQNDRDVRDEYIEATENHIKK